MMKSDGVPSLGVIVVWGFMFAVMAIIGFFGRVKAHAAGEDYLDKQQSKHNLQSSGGQARSVADGGGSGGRSEKNIEDQP